jgi:hypothetical protein
MPEFFLYPTNPEITSEISMVLCLDNRFFFSLVLMNRLETTAEVGDIGIIRRSRRLLVVNAAVFGYVRREDSHFHGVDSDPYSMMQQRMMMSLVDGKKL